MESDIPSTRTVPQDVSEEFVRSWTIAEVQKNWRCLDAENFVAPNNTRLISHDDFTYQPGFETVEYIAPGRILLLFRFIPILFNFLYAQKLLRRTTTDCVLILSGSTTLWLFVGLLNHFCAIRKRRILCWDIFVEADKQRKQIIIRAAMKGLSLCVVWSKDQVASHARFLGMPEERFVYLPYKSNHSSGPRYDLPIQNYIFSGGNGKRNYKCLIEAVRETNIPVIISATDPEVRRQIENLQNVIVLGAPEPAFAQMQAASRFVVIPMIYTGLKGGGEANFCNAMWHEKPVIASDNISAKDYILEGETGYVVPAGDSEALKRRILELWNDPQKVQQMGETARRHAETNFTHVKFIRRLLRLAKLVGD